MQAARLPLVGGEAKDFFKHGEHVVPIDEIFRVGPRVDDAASPFRVPQHVLPAANRDGRTLSITSEFSRA